MLAGFEQNTWASLDNLRQKLDTVIDSNTVIESTCKAINNDVIDRQCSEPNSASSAHSRMPIESALMQSISVDMLQDIQNKCDSIEHQLKSMALNNAPNAIDHNRAAGNPVGVRKPNKEAMSQTNIIDNQAAESSNNSRQMRLSSTLPADGPRNGSVNISALNSSADIMQVQADANAEITPSLDENSTLLNDNISLGESTSSLSDNLRSLNDNSSSSLLSIEILRAGTSQSTNSSQVSLSQASISSTSTSHDVTETFSNSQLMNELNEAVDIQSNNSNSSNNNSRMTRNEFYVSKFISSTTTNDFKSYLELKGISDFDNIKFCMQFHQTLTNQLCHLSHSKSM